MLHCFTFRLVVSFSRKYIQRNGHYVVHRVEKSKLNYFHNFENNRKKTEMYLQFVEARANISKTKLSINKATQRTTFTMNNVQSSGCNKGRKGEGGCSIHWENVVRRNLIRTRCFSSLLLQFTKRNSKISMTKRIHDLGKQVQSSLGEK